MMFPGTALPEGGQCTLGQLTLFIVPGPRSGRCDGTEILSQNYAPQRVTVGPRTLGCGSTPVLLCSPSDLTLQTVQSAAFQDLARFHEMIMATSSWTFFGNQITL